jgi:L-glutamine-phosphate cytidylyltransferase
MKAIIVAAGRGRRLGSETSEIPKCMVAVRGRPILHRQLDALAAVGATDFVVVRGYLGQRIAAPGYSLRFIENREWETNNILASLLYAADEMKGGFLFSYSDIVFAPGHARQVAQSAAEIGLIIDRRWQDTYVGRLQHPVSEAELASVRPAESGLLVDRVGKTVVSPDAAVGEFTGLARFSDAAATALQQVWSDALAVGLEQPFGRAARLRQAYLSDALNALADRGWPLTPLFVDGQWREIDTEEDLARAHAVVETWD